MASTDVHGVTRRIAALTSIGRSRSCDDRRVERNGAVDELNARLAAAVVELRRVAAELEKGIV